MSSRFKGLAKGVKHGKRGKAGPKGRWTDIISATFGLLPGNKRHASDQPTNAPQNRGTRTLYRRGYRAGLWSDPCRTRLRCLQGEGKEAVPGPKAQETSDHRV
jgi:hypothetical protein